jgi:hypothetical protein
MVLTTESLGYRFPCYGGMFGNHGETLSKRGYRFLDPSIIGFPYSGPCALK